MSLQADMGAPSQLKLAPSLDALEPARRLDLCALREMKGVLNVHAEVPDRALDLAVTKQDLNSPQVARCLVNDGRLGPPQRMRSIVLAPKADSGDPLIHQPGILPGADMRRVVGAAGERIVVQRAAPMFGPGEDGRSRRFKDLKLNGPAGLLLDYSCPCPDATAADKVPYADLHHVTSSQLAVHREVEQRSIPQAALAIEPEADRPNWTPPTTLLLAR